jgi:hypothetical protein
MDRGGDYRVAEGDLAHSPTGCAKRSETAELALAFLQRNSATFGRRSHAPSCNRRIWFRRHLCSKLSARRPPAIAALWRASQRRGKFRVKHCGSEQIGEAQARTSPVTGPNTKTRRANMTYKHLLDVTAIVSRRESRDTYRPKGWRAALLEMLRTDVTNVDYLVPPLYRR